MNGFRLISKNDRRNRIFGFDQRHVVWILEHPRLGMVEVSYIDPAPDTRRPECMAFRMERGICDPSEIAVSYEPDPEQAFACVMRDLAELAG